MWVGGEFWEFRCSWLIKHAILEGKQRFRVFQFLAGGRISRLICEYLTVGVRDLVQVVDYGINKVWDANNVGVRQCSYLETSFLHLEIMFRIYDDPRVYGPAFLRFFLLCLVAN